MAKKESTFINMAVTLLVITVIAAGALGYVYQITYQPIQASLLQKKLTAIKEVVPDFNNNPQAEMYKIATADGTDSLECYPAKKDGILLATAIKTYTMNGFSGYIGMMVGLKPDGTIVNTSVLEQKETPGLGTKMVLPEFRNQFKEKNPGSWVLKVKKDGGSVDAITASTISSRAFCDAVERAFQAYEKGGIK